MALLNELCSCSARNDPAGLDLKLHLIRSPIHSP